jgi:ribosome-associated heat shock protein Hsp15
VPAPSERQRIDRWLWHARLVRTRDAAAALADSGYVRVNGQRVRVASRVVHTGDVITVALQHTVRVLKVRGFVEQRGPAATGATLYEDLELSGSWAARSSTCTPISPAIGAMARKTGSRVSG